MIGDVWEWTSSDFASWPGFTPMIYRDYRVPFFGGDYKALRGGSWAVAPSTIRPSFRNWDYPVRRADLRGRANGLGRLSVPSHCLAWPAAAVDRAFA
jgi:gamma-glutamyl hercynylcysteine S-oxide synthase